MTKRIVTLIACLIMLFVSNTVFSSAIKSAPFIVCNVSADSIPTNAQYADLLVKAEQTENNYQNLKKYGISANCGIVNRNNEFSSYTFKTLMSTSEIGLNDSNFVDGDNCFLLSFGDTDNKEQMKTIKSYKQLKVAYLDKNGDVILITNQVNINTLLGLRTLKYIFVDGDSLTVHYSYNIFSIVFLTLIFALVAIIIVVVTKKERFLKETQQ